MNISLGQIKEALDSQSYATNDEILYAVWTSVLGERALLLEGAPGVGKTSIAKAFARGMGLPYIRLQMYEGLTDDKILYDYDYQKQLLTLEAVKPKIEKEYENLSVNEAIHATVNSLDFYGEDFIIKRPILRSITSDNRCVLCIDEIDKAPEEIEYMLYEFLENYSITIPQYKEIVCDKDKKPIVFITSNNYRELSGALKRRCNYLFLKQKTTEEVVEILMLKATHNTHLANGIAKCFTMFQNNSIRQMPSISEAIEYARFLEMNETITKELAVNSLNILVKNNKDKNRIEKIVTENGTEIWEEGQNV